MPKLTRNEAAEHVLDYMAGWLQLSPRSYTPAVRLFALRLPADQLVEALWVAANRKPNGGRPAFKYFCGICWTMIRERSEKAKRN